MDPSDAVMIERQTETIDTAESAPNSPCTFVPDGSEIPPMIQLAIDAADRDMVDLLATNPGQWAAYHGRLRVGIGASKTALIQTCGRQWPRRELYVRKIEDAPLICLDW
jgi:hypothetical protein